MTPKWAHIKRIVTHALDLPTHERGAFLDRKCEGFPELRLQVGELLSERTEMALLDSGKIEAVPRSIGSHFAPDLSGEIVGSYQLGEKIGQGGMGLVYKARRCDGLYEKEVAVKLLFARLTMNREETVRRFQLEKRILAQLDHPNIARLLDAGMTSGGLPYFVMEYVDGRRLDDYVHDHRLCLADRIHLFTKICRAVECAHQHKIIHRDIKSTNIMVRGDGSIVLLDFGIAKVLEGSDLIQEVEADTLPEHRIMTRQFASPEQVKGERLTLSSDIYSLGVLLYHLLTGRSPYPSDVDNLADLESKVCEYIPAKPSKRFHSSDLDSDEIIDQSCQELNSDRHNIRRLLSGDLDSIVEKALRKDPSDRFKDVAELVANIEAFQNRRPVAARRGQVFYRLSRFVTRNHLILKSSLGTAIIIILFTSWFNDTKQSRDGENAIITSTAHVRLPFFDEGIESPIVELEYGVVLREEGQVIKAMKMITAAIKRMEETTDYAPTELARAYYELGLSYSLNGELKKACESMRFALLQFESESDNHAQCNMHLHLGLVEMRRGRLSEAEKALRRFTEMKEDGDELTHKLGQLMLLSLVTNSQYEMEHNAE